MVSRALPVIMLLVGTTTASRGSIAGGDSPVAKVVELLQESKMKVQADLDAESKEMAEYSEFCDSESSEKTYAIKTAVRKIAEYEAAILNGEAQLSKYADEIATLGTTMSNKESQLAAASAERAKQKSDFQATEQELVAAVDQLDRAVVTIKRSTAFVQGHGMKVPKKDLKLALSMISKVLDAGWVSAATRTSLKGLLQTNQEAGDGEDADLALKQPQASVKAYENSASGGVVAQLQDMKEKAEETLSGARQGEMKEQHNFDMMAQSLHDAMKLAADKLSAAKSNSAAVGQENGKAKAELGQTKSGKAADESYLASLQQDCRVANEEWDKRQASGKDELSALEKAKEILVSKVKVFFVQFKSNDPQDQDSDDATDSRKRQLVVQQLKSLGRKIQSFALTELVSSAKVDPFEKIKGLVSEMIVKLTTEANEEATQKSFCDEEISKSKAAQDEKSMTIDKLKSRIDKAATTKAELEQSSRELQEEIAQIDKAAADSLRIRSEEHETYLKASKDFKEAANAVTSAIGVLNEYYSSTGAALLQTKQAPSLGGSRSDTAHSIISILEMCGENFQKLYMESETEETEAVNAYAKLVQENKVAKASKHAELRGKRSEIKSLEVALQNGKEDYDMTSKELDAVMAYVEKLRPQCETKVMSYAEKKARREAEIDGLKEALSMLDAPAAASLVQTRRLRAHHVA